MRINEKDSRRKIKLKSENILKTDSSGGKKKMSAEERQQRVLDCDIDILSRVDFEQRGQTAGRSRHLPLYK